MEGDKTPHRRRVIKLHPSTRRPAVTPHATNRDDDYDENKDDDYANADITVSVARTSGKLGGSMRVEPKGPRGAEGNP